MGWLGDKISRLKGKIDDLDRSDPNIPTGDEYRDEDGKYIIPGFSGEQNSYQKVDPTHISLKELREVENGLSGADYDLIVGVGKAIKFIEEWADRPKTEGAGFLVKQNNQRIQNAQQLKVVIHRLGHDPDKTRRVKCAGVIKAWYATEGVRFNPASS